MAMELAGRTAEQIEIGITAYKHLVELATQDPEAFSEHVRSLHLSGQPQALTDMIYWCATFGWKLPQWAADAFISAADKVRSAQLGSWDEAFGKPYPGKKHVGKVRRSLKSMAIYLRVTELHGPDSPIDNGMFERVGEEFSLAKTQCAELYYAFKKREDTLQAAGLSHFPKNCKTSGNT
jgi:hypothetical protein